MYLVGKQLNCVCIFYCCVLGGRLSSHLRNVKYLLFVLHADSIMFTLFHLCLVNYIRFARKYEITLYAEITMPVLWKSSTTWDAEKTLTEAVECVLKLIDSNNKFSDNLLRGHQTTPLYSIPSFGILQQGQQVCTFLLPCLQSTSYMRSLFHFSQNVHITDHYLFEMIREANGL